jgi:hypothetical protein
VARVEKLLSFKPVSPVEAVRHLVHLELTEVAATRYIVGAKPGRHIRTYSISYVFGHIPRLPSGIPDFGGQSKYMVVVESAGHDAELTKSGQVQIVNVTSGGTDIMVAANLPNKRIVTVESNQGHSLTKRVTLAIVASQFPAVTSKATQLGAQESSSPPRLRLRLLPVKRGVPLTVGATITGSSLCTLTLAATRSNGTRKLIFAGTDADGPRHRQYVGNYFVLAKVPSATKLIVASATCRYTTRGTSRRTRLSASIPIP